MDSGGRRLFPRAVRPGRQATVQGPEPAPRLASLARGTADAVGNEDKQRRPVPPRRFCRERGTGLGPAHAGPLRIHIRPPRNPRRDAMLRLRRQAAQDSPAVAARPWRIGGLPRQGRFHRPHLGGGLRLQPRPLQWHQPRHRPDAVALLPAAPLVSHGWLEGEHRTRRLAASLCVQRRDRPERSQAAGAAGALQEPSPPLGLRSADRGNRRAADDDSHRRADRRGR